MAPTAEIGGKGFATSNITLPPDGKILTEVSRPADVDGIHDYSVRFTLQAPCFNRAQTAAQTAPPDAANLTEYEAYRLWLTKQPVEVQRLGMDGILERYRGELLSRRIPDAEIARILASLRTSGPSSEVERWNRILTSPNPRFNSEPNAFLVQMTGTLRPGRALDVGMGQGRKTIYLAQQGWDAVGFDPAQQAVDAAPDKADSLGVKITTHIATAEDFEWGENQWDLIVISYAPTRESVAHVVRSLRPGGMVVVEGFHRDAAKTASIGGGVVFDDNELLKLFSVLRVVRYEDTLGVADFGRAQTRIVRLAAVKP